MRKQLLSNGNDWVFLFPCIKMLAETSVTLNTYSIMELCGHKTWRSYELQELMQRLTSLRDACV